MKLRYPLSVVQARVLLFNLCVVADQTLKIVPNKTASEDTVFEDLHMANT